MRSMTCLALVAACDAAPAALPDDDPAPDAASEPDALLPRGSFRNPLNGGPDPFLTYADGHYLLATTQGDAIRVWKARSLAELAFAPGITIWQDTDPARNQHVWAPAIYRFDGRWYVY